MDNATSNTGQPACYWHPSTPAVARCVSCGRYICQTCSTRIQNRNFCGACAGAFLPCQYQVQPAEQQRGRQDLFRLKTPLVFPGATWGLGEAIIIFLFATAIAVGATIGLAFLFKDMEAVSTIILLLFLSTAVLQIFLLGGTFYSVLIRHKASLGTIGLKKEGAGRGLALGIGLGFPLYFGGMLLALVSHTFINPPETDVINRSLTGISGGGVSPALSLLLVITLVVLAPVCEEIFFRGYLYPALRNRMGMQSAMIINGCLFAFVHFEALGFLSRALLGYGLSYIFEKNKTLAGPIIGHAIYNGIQVVLFLVVLHSL